MIKEFWFAINNFRTKLVMEKSDYVLLQGIINDDTKAYVTIFDKYWEPVFRFILKKTGNYQQAEDIVQEVFLHVWQRRHKLTIHTSLKNYLLAVAKYMFFKTIDKETLQMDFENYDAYGIDTSTPESCFEFEELFERYLLSIEKLPAKYKEVFKLSHQDQLTISEISKKLNLAPQTVSNRLTTCRQLLKQEIREQYPLIIILFLN